MSFQTEYMVREDYASLDKMTEWEKSWLLSAQIMQWSEIIFDDHDSKQRITEQAFIMYTTSKTLKSVIHLDCRWIGSG